MSEPIIEHFHAKIADLNMVIEGQSQALAKRKEDIDKLTLELQAAKKTIAEHQVKLNWLVPVASMAVFNMKANADSDDVEYTCDDLLTQIRSMR